MADELHTLCFIEPHIIENFRRSFYKTLGIELRSHANLIPCAFAVMFLEPIASTEIRFNMVMGSVKELLPKGSDEIMAMLEKALRDWEEINYPETCGIGETIGSA